MSDTPLSKQVKRIDGYDPVEKIYWTVEDEAAEEMFAALERELKEAGIALRDATEAARQYKQSWEYQKAKRDQEHDRAEKAKAELATRFHNARENHAKAVREVKSLRAQIERGKAIPKLAEILIRVDETLDDGNIVSRLGELGRIRREMFYDPDVVRYLALIGDDIPESNAPLTKWRERIEEVRSVLDMPLPDTPPETEQP